MSRVDDDGGDQHRIREMQENQLRRQVAEEKRGHESVLKKSFGEIIGREARRATEERSARTAPGQEARADARLVLDRVRGEAPRAGAQASKHASLAQGALARAQDKRRGELLDAQRAATVRAEDLAAKAESETEFVSKERVREDDRETLRTEERREEKRAEGRGEVSFDPRDERRGNREGGQSSQDERRAEGPKAVEGPRGAAPPQIPRELIERIVSAIQTAVKADGRTTLQVTLKGGLLEGVKLEVRAENGVVQCAFEGCKPELKALLGASRGLLTQALGNRGFKLGRLEAR